jgi:hypothetical protein
MKLISFLGVLFFTRSLFEKKSIRALIIILNGILYHGVRNDTNNNDPIIKCLRMYDILINIIMISYTSYNNPAIANYAVIAMINFVSHFYIFDTIFFNTPKKQLSMIKESFHAFGVQLPLAIALEQVLDKN